MVTKTVRKILVFLFVMGVCSLRLMKVSAQTNWEPNSGLPSLQTGPLYTQPIDPNGGLFLSARLEPDGSDYDENIWEEFTLPSGGTLTRVEWYGGYDPLKQGKGGPVLDFTISFYASSETGNEPAVASGPLVTYQAGGRAGEAAFAVINGVQLNAYSFDLPLPLAIEANVKYWVQIQASQQGSVPDWCFASATGGNGYRFIKTSGAGGDVLYRFMPGDPALTLLGPITAPATSTPPTSPSPASPTNTPVPTPVPPATPCLSAFLVPVAAFVRFRSSKR